MPDTYLTFGSYLLLKQRSQDGLGSLWRAGEMDKGGFKRIVWLRRFDEPRLDRAALDADMAMTGKLAQTLKATNVVRGAVGGTEIGMPYLAWDYVPAQPLDQVISRVEKEHFPIAVDNALLIVEKLAAALVAAAGVEVRGEALIHGFLLPHLVLVGNDGEAMVAGFGIARGLIANLDRTGVRATAGPYLAPEVLSGGGPSRRSDVYSLGAILFQLLCGMPLPADPATRAGALNSMQLALEEGPVPADIAAILRKALAARPEERHASAAELKRDLERLLYGGAYSPTTFNLALFMDRLYRQEIEDEDRELQRERALDVTPFYKPPKAAAPAPGEITGITEAPAPNRTPMYIAISGVAILLAVVLYLVFGRSPASPSAVDQAAQQKIMGELVGQEVARQLAEKEKELRAQLDQERTQIEAQRKQLQQQQAAAAAAGSKVSPEEQRRIKQAQDELAAREAEQRRKQDELAKVQVQRQQAAVAPPPTAPPPAVPTEAPAAKPTVAAAAAVVEPTAPPRVEVPPTAVPAAAAPAGVPGQVSEGDYVEFADVDVAPQELTKVLPVLSRAAATARAGKGVVILSALVSEKGVVEKVDVLRGFPVQRLGIDEACADAVRQYRYRPATKGGVKVKTRVTVTMQVDLTRMR